MPLKPLVFIGENHNSIVYVARQHAFFKTCVILASCVEQQLETMSQQRPISGNPPGRWPRAPFRAGWRWRQRSAGAAESSRTAKRSRVAPRFARPSVSWTAPATRSGDGAFARTCRRQINHHLRALNSGVALPPSLRYDAASRFPPQSKTLHPCGSHRSARQRLDCGVFSAALVRAPSCGAPSGCTYRVRLGFQVSGFKSQFYSWRLFAARRGYLPQSRASRIPHGAASHSAFRTQGIQPNPT